MKLRAIGQTGLLLKPMGGRKNDGNKDRAPGREVRFQGMMWMMSTLGNAKSSM